MKFLLGLFAMLASSASASLQLRDTPTLYFGGADHQPYLDWLSEKTVEQRYQASTFLPGPEGQGAAIHWKIEGEEILLALAVRATGWAAFGISQAGGMLGADIVYWEASQPDTLTDAFVVEDRFPMPDGCKQDWTLEDKDLTRDGFIMWEGRRKLDTGDARDHPIVQDSAIAVPPHRAIAAWGNSETVGYHARNVARGAIRFHKLVAISTQTTIETDTRVPDFDTAVQGATADFFIGAQNFTIPARETTYEEFCVTKNDMIAQGLPDQALHAIAFEPILTPVTEKYVHHFTIASSASALDNACDDADFMEMVYVWAPGEPAFVLPSNLGGPLFGDTGINAFIIEIHYNNPDGDVGRIDSSGVRFYVTDQLREHELGVLQIGDPFVGLFGEPVGDGLSRHTLTCPGSCSQLALVDEPVTVLREHLHMHKSGVRIVNEQLRDGEKVREGSIEVWEFDQQGNAAVQQQPFQIQPGDSFRTSCYYRDSGDVTFGLGSQEEMCIAFLFYYPRKLVFEQFPWMCGYDFGDMVQCDSRHEFEALPSEEALGRQFGELSETPDCNSGTEGPAATTASPTSAPSPGTNRGGNSSGSPKAFKSLVTMALLVGALTMS